MNSLLLGLALAAIEFGVQPNAATDSWLATHEQEVLAIASGLLTEDRYETIRNEPIELLVSTSQVFGEEPIEPGVLGYAEPRANDSAAFVVQLSENLDQHPCFESGREQDVVAQVLAHEFTHLVQYEFGYRAASFPRDRWYAELEASQPPLCEAESNPWSFANAAINYFNGSHEYQLGAAMKALDPNYGKPDEARWQAIAAGRAGPQGGALAYLGACLEAPCAEPDAIPLLEVWQRLAGVDDRWRRTLLADITLDGINAPEHVRPHDFRDVDFGGQTLRWPAFPDSHGVAIVRVRQPEGYGERFCYVANLRTDAGQTYDIAGTGFQYDGNEVRFVDEEAILFLTPAQEYGLTPPPDGEQHYANYPDIMPGFAFEFTRLNGACEKQDEPEPMLTTPSNNNSDKNLFGCDQSRPDLSLLALLLLLPLVIFWRKEKFCRQQKFVP